MEKVKVSVAQRLHAHVSIVKVPAIHACCLVMQACFAQLHNLTAFASAACEGLRSGLYAVVDGIELIVGKRRLPTFIYCHEPLVGVRVIL